MSNQDSTASINSSIYSQIDLKGIALKQELKDFTQQLQLQLDASVQLAKFEAAYDKAVNVHERENTLHQVNEIKDEIWNDALKKADGDVKKAESIYEDICAFP